MYKLPVHTQYAENDISITYIVSTFGFFAIMYIVWEMTYENRTLASSHMS